MAKSEMSGVIRMTASFMVNVITYKEQCITKESELFGYKGIIEKKFRKIPDSVFSSEVYAIDMENEQFLVYDPGIESGSGRFLNVSYNFKINRPDDAFDAEPTLETVTLVR